MSYPPLNDESMMPFGKYRNVPMKQVPAGYLNWLWNKGVRNDVRSPLADYISSRMQALKQEEPDLIWEEGFVRKTNHHAPKVEKPPIQWWQVFGVDPGASKDLVVERYRKLSKVWHPDAGGNLEKMKELNEAMEAFKEDYTSE